MKRGMTRDKGDWGMINSVGIGGERSMRVLMMRLIGERVKHDAMWG